MAVICLRQETVLIKISNKFKTPDFHKQNYNTSSSKSKATKTQNGKFVNFALFLKWPETHLRKKLSVKRMEIQKSGTELTG